MKKHLPIFGIGPYFVSFMFITTYLILKSTTIMQSIEFAHVNNYYFIYNFVGYFFILVAIHLYYGALKTAKITTNIKQNNLVTTGVYSRCRNPIYSAFLLADTSIILFQNNYILLLLSLIYYGILTLLIIHTEEKWCIKQFGDAYIEYCKKVNRIIPSWIP